MNILESIILGIVQGLTEFLPISSSGHLILLHDLFHWQTADNLTFDVFLHWGTLVALIIFFYKDIIRYLKAFLKSLSQWDIKNDLDQKIAWLILISMIPAVIIGCFLEKVIDVLFRTSFAVAIFLILIAFVFFIVEKFSQKQKDLSSLNWSKALIFGFAQAVALIPGVSRSGITISTGLGLKLKREVAARFSFLMSIPVVFAAGLKKIYDLKDITLNNQEIMLYLVGFLSTVLVGYFCIKFLLNYLKSHTLNIFAYYRLILGALVLLYLMIK